MDSLLMLLGVSAPILVRSNAGNVDHMVRGAPDSNAPILDFSSVGNVDHVGRGVLDNMGAASVDNAVSGRVGHAKVQVSSGRVGRGPINAMVVGGSRMALLGVHVAAHVAALV